MKLILLFGLRRSGNHFLISTILQHSPNHVHINDSYLSYEEYTRHKQIDVIQRSSNQKYVGFKDVDCVVISMENKRIDWGELEKFQVEPDVYTILLLRNPYNNLSSVWKSYNKHVSRTKEILELWPIYAELFLHNTKFRNVLYDEFCTNEMYRNEILHTLGIQHIQYDSNSYIRYQQSSFSNTELRQRCYGSLHDCVYKDDPAFCKLFESTNIDMVWENVLSHVRTP